MIKFRLTILLFAFVNLLVGIIAGLIRIGWGIQVGTIAVHHGAIMVGGFLGTLILVEKVIPLKKKMLFVFPVINGLSLLAVVPSFYPIAKFFLLFGSAGLIVVFVFYLYKQARDLSMMFMVVGACCQVIGHFMLIAKQFYPMAFPWWMAFILFVIVGERVELSKFMPVTQRDKAILVGILTMFLLGLCLPFHGYGKYLSGVSLVLVSAWLLRHDFISISIKKKGLTRFSATALLAGCLALMLTGVFLISLPELPFAYDVTVHTFFLGFTFSMIFAHGPIILPGVLGLTVKPYTSFLYLPLVLLSLSLLLRIMADLSVIPLAFRLRSGWITVASLLLYFVLLITSTIQKITDAETI